jgi:C4-dicarboxylate transporter/malic acid transport protein
MGTGIVPIALLFSEGFLPPARWIGIGFFVVTIIFFITVVLLSALRLLFARQDFSADMASPVAGNFVSTLPISAIVLAIDFMQIGPRLFSERFSVITAITLFLIGTLGIYLLGLAASAIMFGNKDVKVSHATFGWFIPPVSQLIVPVAGLDLITHLEDSPLSGTIFMVSMMSLGIGIMLFIFVGANIYHRYLYHELPSAKMAPTVMIGLAPTAILVIILVKMAALAVSPASPWTSPAFPSMVRVLAPMAWGFSAWWFALAVVLLSRYVKAANVDFTLSWWALAFPLGALTVSTGALNKLFGLAFLGLTVTVLTILLLFVWFFVVLGTIRIIANGSVFR